MFRMGQTPFYLFPTRLGWEVQYYHPTDKRQRGGEFLFCWVFQSLDEVFIRLPELARLKIKCRHEKLEADARELEKWLKQTGKEALPHLQVFHKLLQESIEPLAGWRPKASGTTYPLIGTRFQLTYLGRNGWEILETEPGGKPEFKWHSLELSHLLKGLPLLLSESSEAYRDKKLARGSAVKYYEITVVQTRKIIRQLQKELQATGIPPAPAFPVPQELPKAPAKKRAKPTVSLSPAPVIEKPRPRKKEVAIQQTLF